MGMHGCRLKERIGSEPTDEQLAASLRMSRAELQSKLIECSLAREKLAISNVRLVMSIAQRYDNMGAEMADLVQVSPNFYPSLPPPPWGERVKPSLLNPLLFYRVA